MWLEGKGVIKLNTIYIIYLILGILVSIWLINLDGGVIKKAKKQDVYICTGGQSKRYHSTDECIGLSKCSRDIKKISIDEAKDLKRTPCGYCY